MTTYTEDEIALARRGALLVGWRDNRDYHALIGLTPSYGWNTPIDRGDAVTDRDLLADGDVSGALFVALLDKCDAEGIGVLLFSKTGKWSTCVRVAVSAARFAKTHPHRTLVLLLALDAAGLLPKEDA